MKVTQRTVIKNLNTFTFYVEEKEIDVPLSQKCEVEINNLACALFSGENMKIKYYVIYDKLANLYYQGDNMWATDIEYGERYKSQQMAIMRLIEILKKFNSQSFKENLCVLKIKIKEVRL